MYHFLWIVSILASKKLVVLCWKFFRWSFDFILVYNFSNHLRASTTAPSKSISLKKEVQNHKKSEKKSYRRSRRVFSQKGILLKRILCPISHNSQTILQWATTKSIQKFICASELYINISKASYFCYFTNMTY